MSVSDVVLSLDFGEMNLGWTICEVTMTLCPSKARPAPYPWRRGRVPWDVRHATEEELSSDVPIRIYVLGAEYVIRILEWHRVDTSYASVVASVPLMETDAEAGAISMGIVGGDSGRRIKNMLAFLHTGNHIHDIRSAARRHGVTRTIFEQQVGATPRGTGNPRMFTLMYVLWFDLVSNSEDDRWRKSPPALCGPSASFQTCEEIMQSPTWLVTGREAMMRPLRPNGRPIKSPGKDFKKSQVVYVTDWLVHHFRPAKSPFYWACGDKRDDLADCFLQIISFYRNFIAKILKREVKKKGVLPRPFGLLSFKPPHEPFEEDTSRSDPACVADLLAQPRALLKLLHPVTKKTRQKKRTPKPKNAKTIQDTFHGVPDMLARLVSASGDNNEETEKEEEEKKEEKKEEIKVEPKPKPKPKPKRKTKASALPEPYVSRCRDIASRLSPLDGVGFYVYLHATTKSTYIGSSPNPSKRFLQHCGVYAGGAKALRNHDDIRPVLVVSGFASLQHQVKFETKWQKRRRSDRSIVVKVPKGPRSLVTRLRKLASILEEPLSVAAKLSVHWLWCDEARVSVPFSLVPIPARDGPVLLEPSPSA